ncbi:MAG: MFS transporter [Candidatus Binatia bacterium]
MSDRLLSAPFLRVTLANLFLFLNLTAYFLLPLHLRTLGAGDAVIGWVMGTAGFASMAALPFVGLTIDRWGRRIFLFSGAIGLTLAAIGFLFVDSLGPSMYALRFLQGVSLSASFTATTTFAAAFAPPNRRAQALGVFGLSTVVTHAVSAGVGEEIVIRGGFDALFAATAFCSVVALILALPLREAAAARRARVPGERRLHGVHWIVAATMFLIGLGFGAVHTFMPTFITDEGLGRIGFYSAAYTSACILSRVMAAGLSDSFGRRQVIVPALMALACAMFWFSRVHSVPSLLAAGAVLGLAQGVTYPTLHALVVDLAGEAQLGRSQALFSGAFTLGLAASASAFGLVAEAFGYRVMFTLVAVMPIAAGVVFAIGTARVPIPVAAWAGEAK